MANIEVDTRADTVDATDGVTSLREALALAANSAEADTITFDAGVFTPGNGTIQLTQGQLAITQAGGLVTIQGDLDGNGTADVTIDANHHSNVLQITGASDTDRAQVSLEGLTITGGRGGIDATYADLHIDHCDVTGNSGSGIWTWYGSASISGSTISDNHGDWGGGIAAFGDLMVTDSLITGNSASQFYSAGMGGGILVYGGSCALVNSTVSANIAAGVAGRKTLNGGGMGGGIAARRATLLLVNSSVVDNQALSATYYDSTYYGEGGGIWLDESVVSFANAIIARNAADRAADIYDYGSIVANGIAGTEGADVLAGSPAEDGIAGLGGNDTIDTGGGNDLVLGGTGSDSLDGGAGADSMVGGEGDDRFVVDDAGDVTEENASQGLDTVLSSVSRTLGDNLENLTLTGAANIDGTGNALANVIAGAAGANSLLGLAGNDAITGGLGNDTVDGGTGADSMRGGAGDDLYRVDNVLDVADESGTTGTDTVESTVSWTLGSGFENLILANTAGEINATGNEVANRLAGNDRANSILGQAGDDTITGGFGNDTEDGGIGADSMRGGAGDDLYRVDNVLDVTDESGTTGTDTVESTVSWTLGSGFENLILANTAGEINATGNEVANRLAGNDRANSILGQAGNDTITGGFGNDTEDGGIGADSMRGGAGDDLYRVDNALDVTDESGTTGIDTVESTVSWTLGSGLENLILANTAGEINATGNEVANRLAGNDRANSILGQAGNDTITGGFGNDTEDGGIGADSMRGGAGDDLYRVDNVLDVTDESGTTGIDTVESTVSWTLGSGLENLTLIGAANVDGIGNGLANAIVGNDGANSLLGQDGDDVLNGGVGNDTVDGGLGNDSMRGGAGNDLYRVNTVLDIVDETGTSGIDRVESSVGWTLGAGFENLALTGAANIDGTGNALGNMLTGNAASNVLSGAAGADVLAGGRGADRLIGGAGNDIFDYNAAADSTVVAPGRDTIVGFDGVGSGPGDRIDLSDLYAGTLAFVSGPFTAAGQVHVIEAGAGNSLIEVNLAGSLAPDFAILVQDGAVAASAWTVQDFIL